MGLELMYDNAEVKEIIEQEGMHYGLTEYIGPSNIQDPKLRRLAEEFVRASREIEDYLETPRDAE